MVENNLNRKENLRRANDFVKSIKTYPVELMDVKFEFDAFDSLFDSITEKELSLLIDKTLETSTKFFGKKIKFVVYPLLQWEENEKVHRITIKFILVGKNFQNKIKNFQEKLEDFCDEVWGGDLKIRYVRENSMEDVFIEVFPVQFDTYLFNYDIFAFGNHFLKFYSRDLFRFLTSPMEIY
jgi:hypothetical protein